MPGTLIAWTFPLHGHRPVALCACSVCRVLTGDPGKSDFVGAGTNQLSQIGFVPFRDYLVR